ncbi:4'-phosphopantetheinyl transferase superfamily protein [Aureibaculum sp. 2210JD6-5]|uniref:4'-phosphopantetheinyl transferase family protein n=1 Tax=Aureibaculum sp. 2210JD6-5 TaxID=3103957 RepID=UPI002AAE9DC6|nr:4'-phosphopantetheinyl transferase superfamily protein [Aureibaculum sp. 2210JD6-5]MDY7395778.1 4'-phosphopantetheinyl transferase superfamily protein [Aureibaculum sp. 2210JD6-5]
MIGNDIVDLNLARTQSNWKRNGFLEKIFTKKEQEYIKNAKNSFEMVWLLWSMKESAYKIYSRQNSVRFFAPKKFECDISAEQHKVQINNSTYFTTSNISNDCIHTIALLNINESFSVDFFKLNNDTYEVQNKTTYKNLKSAISNRFDIPISKVKIEKDTNGIPRLNQKQMPTISISHHGVFGSYALCFKKFVCPARSPRPCRSNS